MHLYHGQILNAFPPFNLIRASMSKIRREMAAGTMIYHGGDTVLVSDDGASFSWLPSRTSSEKFDNTVQHTIATSLVSKNETAGISFIGKAYWHTEFPSEVTNAILESWQSPVRFKRWNSYAVTFMHGMYLDGYLYSGLCTAHSTLPTAVTIRGYLEIVRTSPGFTILERHI